MRRDDTDVFNIIEQKGIDLSTMDILSPYAKEGEYRTIDYAKKAAHLTAWEINPDYYEKLIQNLPSNTDSKLCDSCEEIYRETRKYDFVIVDPYFGSSTYVEGFFLFPRIYEILKPHAFIVTVILLDPYPYSWARGYGVSQPRRLVRRLFYGTRNEIVTNQEVETAYRRHARGSGFELVWDAWSWSFSDTCFYVQELKKQEVIDKVE